MISVAAIRMQQFGVSSTRRHSPPATSTSWCASRCSVTATSRAAGVRGGNKRAPSKIRWDLLDGGSPRARRRISGRSSARRSTSSSSTTSSAVRPATCRRFRRRHHLLRREAVVRAGRLGKFGRTPESAGARRHPRAIDGQHRLLACTPTSRTSRTSSSRCRRSSSIVCPKITSCRCSSRSTPSTPGSTRRTWSRCPDASSPGRGPGRGPRRGARPQRPRGFAAPQRDQAARRGQGPGGPGAARAGVQAALRRRGRAGRPAKAPSSATTRRPSRQLLRAGLVGLRDGLARPQVQHPIGDRPPRLRARRPRRRAGGRAAARRTHRLPGHRTGDCAVGPRIGALRFETDGAWKRSGATVDGLARSCASLSNTPRRRPVASPDHPDLPAEKGGSGLLRPRPLASIGVARLAPPSVHGTNSQTTELGDVAVLQQLRAAEKQADIAGPWRRPTS